MWMCKRDLRVDRLDFFFFRLRFLCLAMFFFFFLIFFFSLSLSAYVIPPYILYFSNLYNAYIKIHVGGSFFKYLNHFASEPPHREQCSSRCSWTAAGT